MPEAPASQNLLANKERLADAAARMRAVFDEGSPAVIPNLGHLFTADEVFEWIKRAHPRKRANTSRAKIIALKQSWGLSPAVPRDLGKADPGRSAELYREGALVLDPSPFLPAPDDGFDAWIEATRVSLGPGFGMQAPGIECASWDAFERLHGLLELVLESTGPRTYRFNAFLGDYRTTPFGFHVDPHQEAVFQVVLVGRRRGFFWQGLTLSEDDDAAWVEDSNRLHEPRREPEAVFDLEPGDLMFWPGTHVHGFEAEGPSLALSIVVDRASPRSKAEIVAALEVATLGGRAALPSVEDDAKVDPSAQLRRRIPQGLAYERFDDSLVVGVCGRVFDWPDPTSISTAIELLKHLQTHDHLVAGEVARAFANERLPAEDILGVLSMLAGLGYLA